MKKKTIILLVLIMANISYGNELEDKVDALIEEVASLKESKTDKQLLSHHGLGQSASKVFTSTEKVSIGGYGHTDYINKVNKIGDTIDNYRNILYLGYRFSNKIIFNSEIEFEHTNELSVEFSTLDFLHSDALNFRIGNLLVPLGSINYKHEPTLFNTVTRPETERYIIPATWSENGAMIYGKWKDLEYSLALIAALDANKGTTIRSMRSAASQSAAEDIAGVMRLAYKPSNDLEVAFSGYFGEADQGNTALEGSRHIMLETHFLYKIANLEIKGLYAKTITDHAEKIALEHNSSAASSTQGYYLNLSYTMGAWTPFSRFESYNTFLEGFDQNGLALGNQKSVHSLAVGINYFPHPQVVLKLDYLFYDDRGTRDDRTEFGMGYLF